MRNVGNRIRENREALSITQQNLADATKMSRNYISLIESGKKSPSLSAISEISKHLNVKPIDLLRDTKELSSVREAIISEYGGIQNLRDIIDSI
jgi:transcriptional regulator with XRE-family HTH domain